MSIQRRRDDLPRLIAYFREQDVPYSLNHAFSSLTGRRDASDWSRFDSLFPILEIRNGHMLPVVNSLAARLVRETRKGGVAGSDAHTLFSLGSAFTEVRGARSRAEFIDGLREHRGRAHGEHGTYWKLTRDLIFIGLKMIQERPVTAPLLPLALLIPLASFANYLNEARFRSALETLQRGQRFGSVGNYTPDWLGGFRRMNIAAGTQLVFPSGRFKFIKRRDYALMHRIHNWSAPAWIRLFMISATRGGDGWLWYMLTFGILLFGDENWWRALLAGLCSCGAGLAIYVIVKKTTRRTRPCLIEPNQWAQILPPDQYSFPSGHTISAFAIAISLGLYYPVLMPILLFCASVIAISRIMLGMHFLSDVVVGALIGTSLGFFAHRLIQ